MKTLKNNAAKLGAMMLVLVLSQAYAQADLLKSAATRPTSTATGNTLFVASQGPDSGRLTTRGNNPITVNGTSAKTGDTIFSGQQIQTPANVGATIQLGASGRVDAAPNTDFTLTFENGKINVVLVSGCVILTANKGVTGTLQTGSLTQQTDPSKGGVLDVCAPATPGGAPVAGQGAAAAAGAGAAAGGGAAGGAVAAAAATGEGLFGLGTAGTIGFIATAGVITTAVIVAETNNDRPNPSPARP